MPRPAAIKSNARRPRRMWAIYACATIVVLACFAARVADRGASESRFSFHDDQRLLADAHAGGNTRRTTAAIVQALASRQDKTRIGARHRLLDLVAAWKQLPAQQAAGKLNVLASTLAAGVPQFDDDTRDFAAELATEMLNWRIVTAAAGCSEMIAACDQILHITSPPIGRPATARAPIRGRATRSGGPPAIADLPFTRPTREEPLLPTKDMPGGGLPVEISQSPQLDSDTPADLAADPQARELTPSLADRRRARRVRAPEANPAPVERPATPLRQPETEAIRISGEIPDAVDDNAEIVRRMHQLHDRDQRIAEEAAAHLQKRGFGRAQLELARQLTDPDPAVRQQLAESLPRASGIDVEVWLIWLSRDEDAQVRLAALTVMASTGEPRLLKRVAQMAREDSDARIQQQGEKIMSALQSDK